MSCNRQSLFLDVQCLCDTDPRFIRHGVTVRLSAIQLDKSIKVREKSNRTDFPTATSNENSTKMSL
jgi:hypothetical protein